MAEKSVLEGVVKVDGEGLGNLYDAVEQWAVQHGFERGEPWVYVPVLEHIIGFIKRHTPEGHCAIRINMTDQQRKTASVNNWPENLSCPRYILTIWQAYLPTRR